MLGESVNALAFSMVCVGLSLGHCCQRLTTDRKLCGGWYHCAAGRAACLPVHHQCLGDRLCQPDQRQSVQVSKRLGVSL